MLLIFWIAIGTVDEDAAFVYSEKPDPDKYMNEEVTGPDGNTYYRIIRSLIWEDIQNKIDGGQELITLKDDILAGEEDLALQVPAGKSVRIDLNGHTLDRSLTYSKAKNEGYVIGVSGELTLEDSSSGQKGRITGGKNTGNGGGIYVADGGSLTASGISISNNISGQFGGGIFVADGGDVSLDNLTIEKNKSAKHGGGIYFSAPSESYKLYKMSHLTITGNKTTVNQDGQGAGLYVKNGNIKLTYSDISSNTSSNSGGGVFVESGNIGIENSKIQNNYAFAMSNGAGVYINKGNLLIKNTTIRDNTGNKRNDKGVGVYSANGQISVSGETRIIENYYIKGTERTPSNVYLTGDSVIDINVILFDTADIGVTKEKKTGVFTNGLPEKGTAANFTSDDTNYGVRINSENNEAELRYVRAINFDDSIASGSIIAKVDGQTVTKGAEKDTVELVIDKSVAVNTITVKDINENELEVSKVNDHLFTFTMPSTEVTVFAETEKQKYTVTFKNYDGTVLQSSDAEYGETPVYTGETPVKEGDAQYSYEFKGWSPEITAVTEEATYTAEFNEIINEYTVIFKTDEGSLIGSEKVKYGNKVVKPTPEPERKGYKFAGWYLNGKEYDFDTAVTENIELVQKWLTVVSLVYIDGDENESAETVYAETFTSYSVPTVTDREGYEFKGWKVNDELKTTADETQSAVIELVREGSVKTVTVKEVFEEIPDHSMKNTSKLSSETALTNEAVTVICSAKGGQGEYKFDVCYKRADDVLWTVRQYMDANENVELSFTETGLHDVCVKAYDGEGTVAKKYFTVNVSEGVFINTSVISSETAASNEAVSVTCSAENGSGDYKYDVCYKRADETRWTIKQYMSSNQNADISFTETGIHDICVRAHDSDGTIIKKYFRVDVSEGIFKNNSTLSTDDVRTNVPLTVRCSADGGSGEYKYSVLYKRVYDSNWTVKQYMKTDENVDIIFEATGMHDICIKAYDAEGKVIKKYFRITVSGGSVINTSVISSSEVEVNEKLTVHCSADFTDTERKYSVLYKRGADTGWAVKQYKGTDSDVELSFTSTGWFDVCVIVYDGNGTAVKKYFRVKASAGSFRNTSRLSAYKTASDEKINVICSSEGGAGEIVYGIFCKKINETKWTVKQKYSDITDAALSFDKTGVYNVCVIAKDTDGTVVKRYFRVSVS